MCQVQVHDSGTQGGYFPISENLDTSIQNRKLSFYEAKNASQDKYGTTTYISSSAGTPRIIMQMDQERFIAFIDEEENLALWRDRIKIDPSVLVGLPAIKGTRLGVDLILDLLAWGWSESEILENYPNITREDIKACLSFASAMLRRGLPGARVL
jgi:uncharacterized protein (DUF433 family)